LDDPTSFALLRIGKCYEKLGNSEMALQFFHKCVEEDALLDKGWIAITDFYYKRKNFQKALYYIDKAINIDSENVLYWKRYAKINKKLNLFEEAEHGFRRSIELGNYELETWIARADILLQLGEFEAAINNLHQAAEFYVESAEIEYRLAGVHYLLNEDGKGEFHLKNALKFEPEYAMIIEEIFPAIYGRKSVQQLIKNQQNPSL
jgi:tetratricopeptide (TPR) repeat protein